MTPRPLVLVIEHEAACPPAQLGHWLEDASCELHICRPYGGEPVPELEGYDALLVLGGSMGANDDAGVPWLGQVKDRLREAVGTRLPTLGICLGHQLLACALGGTVRPNPRGQQVGILPMGWTAAAGEDVLAGAVTSATRGVQWNSDIVTELPPGATLLAATAQGEPQFVRFAEQAWGVQLHPEAGRAVVQSWAAGDRDDHLERGIDQDAVLDGIGAAEVELADAWRPLALRFAELAGAPR